MTLGQRPTRAWPLGFPGARRGSRAGGRRGSRAGGRRGSRAGGRRGSRAGGRRGSRAGGRRGSRAFRGSAWVAGFPRLGAGRGLSGARRGSRAFRGSARVAGFPRLGTSRGLPRGSAPAADFLRGDAGHGCHPRARRQKVSNRGTSLGFAPAKRRVPATHSPSGSAPSVRPAADSILAFTFRSTVTFPLHVHLPDSRSGSTSPYLRLHVRPGGRSP
jgi:hypothetical protein